VTFEGGDPPRGAGIELSPVPSAPSNDPASANIHDDWTFELAGITGPRRLRVLRPPRGWALKAILLNSIDITDTPLMFGSTDQSVHDVEVVLTNRVSAISGVVSDSRGNPVPGSHVMIYARDRELRYSTSRFLAHATAGPDGAYVVRALPPGEYFAVAVERIEGNDAGGEWQDPVLLEALAVKAASVTLAEGQQMRQALRVSAR
jgi:hypothetical protein